MNGNLISVNYRASLFPAQRHSFLESLEPMVKNICLTAACLTPQLTWKIETQEDQDIVCLYANAQRVTGFSHAELNTGNLASIEQRLTDCFLHFTKQE